MRKVVAVLALTGALAIGAPIVSASAATPAASNVYDFRGFVCGGPGTGSFGHGFTSAQAKQWENGRSGTMQFQQIYYAEIFYNGKWHVQNSHEYDSNIFADTAAGHSFGYFGERFDYRSTYLHREQVVLRWWHRNPDRIVASKTAYTKACFG